MTSVYGVTFIGARLQILNRLKERCPIAVDPVDTYRAAGYAAKVHPLTVVHDGPSQILSSLKCWCLEYVYQ